MGIVFSRARVLLNAKTQGVDFSTTLTLGRQKNNMTSSELAHLGNLYSIPIPPEIKLSLKYRSYADPFFYHFLGVNRLSVLDISPYENAEIIHDMNYPVSEQLEKYFDVVIDGGTLEHIFNFPIAIENCMKMLKDGGNLFIFSMANNHCGHGFYQFSPELFFRIFQPDNGFIIKSIILMKHPFVGAELSRRQECFEIRDPRSLNKRALLITNSPVGIMVHAEKKAHKEIFKHYPQQSDYTKKWTNNEKDMSAVNNSTYPYLKENRNVLIKYIWKLLPLRFRLFITGLNLRRKYSFKGNHEFFDKW